MTAVYVRDITSHLDIIAGQEARLQAVLETDGALALTTLANLSPLIALGDIVWFVLRLRTRGLTSIADGGQSAVVLVLARNQVCGWDEEAVVVATGPLTRTALNSSFSLASMVEQSSQS